MQNMIMVIVQTIGVYSVVALIYSEKVEAWSVIAE
jgi:hypothetical protein